MKASLLCLALLLFVPLSALSFDNGINDLHGGTPAPPGGSPPPPGGGPGPDGGPSSGDPVAIFTGQYFLNTTDLEIPGRIPLRVRRFYRSGSTYQGMFGRGWNLEFNERLFVTGTNGNLVLRRNGTARDEFVRSGNNTFVSTNGGFETITRNTDGSYTLRDRFGTRREYGSDGALLQVADRHGNQLFLTYHEGGRLPINAISEHSHLTNAILVARDYRLRRIETGYSNQLSGRFIEFTYDNNGRVTNVTDFTGRNWSYTYDSEGYGNLLSVRTPATPTHPSGLTTRYTYATNSHWLQTVTDRSGNTLLTNHYDSAGRVIRQDWGNATWTFGYPNATNRWETNGLGHRILRVFDAQGNMRERREFTAGLRPGEPEFHRHRFEYSSAGQVTRTLNPSGNVTVYRYDSSGNLTEIRVKATDGPDSPDDVVTTMTYEPRYHALQSQTGPRGDETLYHYTYKDAGQNSVPGDIVRIEFPEVGGRSTEISYAYNQYGQIARITNEVGMVTHFEYDDLTGYLLRRIEGFGTPLAATNTFTYDPRGNILTSTDPRGNTTTHEYDALDRLVEVRTPGPSGKVTRYSHTGNGKPWRIERETGDPSHPWQVTEYAYDILDRLIRITDGLGQSVEYSYDANGNLASVRDANGNVTSLAYDERNLLWKVTDALTNTVTFSYSPNGLPLAREDARGNGTTNVYDLLDRVVATIRPDGATEQFLKDVAGNTIARRSFTGRWTTNLFDALGRLTATRSEGGRNVDYTLDAAGRILQVVATNGTWSFGYDLLGRRTAATNELGLVTRYAYDRAGNLTQLTYPDGTFLTYAYDALNRLTNVSYQGTRLVAALTYDRLGRRETVTFGNGTRTRYTYDAGDRILEIVHQPAGGGPDIARFTQAYDAAGNPTNQNVVGVGFTGPTTYQYDRTHQLVRAQYAAGGPFSTQSIDYDPAGNRTRVTANQVVDYVVNRRNQYTSVGGQPYTYDANGALTSDSQRTFNHDDDSQLEEVLGPGLTARYSYDPFRRRTKKEVNGVTRHFVYNEVGDFPMLLAEAAPNGNLLAKYVIYGMSPLAMIVGDSVFSLHCDSLERPIAATDPGGAVAWRGAFSAFGETSVGAGSTVDQPLRTPGQYSDTETGLHYNMARYYSPALGRFLSEDPAVEAASPLFVQVQERNAYAYVRNNPTSGIDPNGQSVFFIACSAGIPVCSAALFCSLNAGACSGGLICSANFGACSAAVACSGNAGAGCSASIAACSANVAAACSGTAGGVCSGAVACSAQLGSGVGACSGSVLACSAQAGLAGASACSANLAGVCSAQAGVVGGSACSAQVAGICSAQVGAGGSACSAQMAGACSGQFGPGVSLCSGQMGGACSLQLPAGDCSAQAQGCSGEANCKQGALPHRWRRHSNDLLGGDPPSLAGWWMERTSDGGVTIRFVASGSSRYSLRSTSVGSDEAASFAQGEVCEGAVVRFDLPPTESSSVLLVLESPGRKPVEIGPIAIPQSSRAPVVAETPKRPILQALYRSVAVLLGWQASNVGT